MTIDLSDDFSDNIVVFENDDIEELIENFS